MQERAGSDEGEVIRVVDRIMDIVFLQEMSAYNPDGNFDTISASILAMFMLKENVLRIEAGAQDEMEKDDFFSRGLYGGTAADRDESLVDWAGEPDYGSAEVSLY